MNKMIDRRNFLRLTATAVGAAALAACAPTAPNAGNQGASTVEGEKPAGTAGYQGKVRVLSLQDQEKYAPMIKRIEENFPGIQIDWAFFPSEKYTELFAAAEVAGDQIDIMHLNGQDLRRYATSNKLQDLTNSGIDTKRFRQVGLDTYSINGKLFGLPLGGITGFPFLVNKKALAKAGITEEPETYDDLKAMAVELKKVGVAPFVHQGKNIYMWPIWYFFAYSQATNNQCQKYTFDVLSGSRKFTDPESVAALESLYRYAKDGMFIDSVNSMDGDAAWAAFAAGKGAFFYEHSWRIGFWRANEKDLPGLDMSLIAPVREVSDANVKRQLPGGTGDPLCLYAGIKPERQQIVQEIIDFWSQDENVKWSNDLNGDPVSTNVNVEASSDPLALKYAAECADYQVTYLDWFWPPEITRTFQEQQQQLVANTTTPDKAAMEIQNVLDDLREEGYTFES